MCRRAITVWALAAVLVVSSCSSGGSDATPPTVTPGASASGSTAGSAAALGVLAGEPFPEERCAANEAAGTITFLTGFDFAAASSIVEVLAADAAGYYDDLCLDVEIRPSNSTANYPLVAAGNAQFASGGSFSEVVNFSIANDARFLATSVDGRSSIDTLMIKAGQATELADLEGTTIGVKFKMPPSIDVMLRNAGLVEGEDYDTVLLDGFDPLAHIAISGIVGLPGWKSNEVGILDRAGVGLQLFDPLDYGVPGSFGAIFTSAEFAQQHPTAAADFVRATARGLADAIADPAAAAATATAAIEANGNPMFLSSDGETFRWETEADLIMTGTPEGVGFGTPDVASLQTEVDAYAKIGLFGADTAAIDAGDFVGTDVIAGVYDDTGIVVWPA